MTTLIKNALIVNECSIFKGSVLINKSTIQHIYKEGDETPVAETIIDVEGKVLIPGIIDDQVHFREPGLTHKGDIFTESRAAVAGGVTSFMDMPNTKPPTITIDLLEDKYTTAIEKSIANYSFYFGATNENWGLLKNINPKNICGVKVFMGSSTGNMLVDDAKALAAIFNESPVLVATHCENESIIRYNTQIYREKYGNNIPFRYHPLIRSEEACYRSTAQAVELAQQYGTRLHVLHLTTAKELSLFNRGGENHSYIPRITAEACVHHLWFCDKDYDDKGPYIKCNPAIKTEEDRDMLRKAVQSDWISIVATDHAPHTLEKKQNAYFECPSGLPLIQHSLSAMLEMYHQGIFKLETIVERMCHAPAKIFGITKRGYIREGYYADLVLIDMNAPYTVSKDKLLYKCSWSPFEGQKFRSKVTHTWVNGNLVYENGTIHENGKAMRLEFER
ncbi:MAG: dihydroorotase [Prevotellaceae bacterium]|jgi:dihydroorotase|nr:dihydroorotase [Prevotellaceae bacterium]